MIWMPAGVARHLADDADRADACRSAGSGSSTFVACSDQEHHPIARRARGSPRRSTPARFTASGSTLSGKRDGFAQRQHGKRRGDAVVGRSAMGGCRYLTQCRKCTVKRAKLKYPFEMALNERDFFTEKTGDPRHAADLPALPPEERLPAQVGPADQEERIPPGADERDRALLREAARLHDPGRRRRALPDVPHPVRGAVPSVARVPAGRRGGGSV